MVVGFGERGQFSDGNSSCFLPRNNRTCLRYARRPEEEAAGHHDLHPARRGRSRTTPACVRRTSKGSKTTEAGRSRTSCPRGMRTIQHAPRARARGAAKIRKSGSLRPSRHHHHLERRGFTVQSNAAGSSSSSSNNGTKNRCTFVMPLKFGTERLPPATFGKRRLLDRQLEPPQARRSLQRSTRSGSTLVTAPKSRGHLASERSCTLVQLTLHGELK